MKKHHSFAMLYPAVNMVYQGDQFIVYSAFETNEDQLLHYEEEIESVEMRLCKNSPGFEYIS